MKAILMLTALYLSLALIAVLNSSAGDDSVATSKVHFEYQQF